jgi:hypothetical protein
MADTGTGRDCGTTEQAAENRAGQNVDELPDGLVDMVQAFRRARQGREGERLGGQRLSWTLC